MERWRGLAPWFSLALTQLFVFLYLHADEVLKCLLHNADG